MIKATGIVAEYNPFHNGHKLQIDRVRSMGAEHIVAVMSGSFVQRGEPAVFDKFVRTRAALLNGVDIVIELPTVYACASAEFFASSAVSLMEKSGVVESICFGSESGDIEKLSRAAGLLIEESDVYKSALKLRLDSGDAYHAARAKAFAKTAELTEIEDIEFFKSPNNILAIEYLKALSRQQSNIIPITIKREDKGYHSLDMSGAFASAAAIRRAMAESADYAGVVPGNVLDLYKKSPANRFENYTTILKYIAAENPDELSGILDVSEGLENRIIECLTREVTAEAMIDAIKTKRYARTRIQRVLAHMLLNITKDDFNLYETSGGPQYLRVLGVRRESRCLIHELPRKAALPLVMNLKADEQKLSPIARKMLEKDILATKIHNIGTGNNVSDYRNGLVVI